jgi:TetR/AcrR family transcriptional regulator, tetracycline repressor protein
MDTVLPLLCEVSSARHTGPVTTTSRRSPGRPPVPLDRIIATALRIVDEEGPDALSMRTLAQRLESGTATLYRHFTNRAELIAQVVDHMFGEVDLDADELARMSWREACRTIAHAMFATLGRHRNMAPLVADQLPAGPNAMTLRERCLAILLDNGFPPRLAARAYATVARHVLGFAIQQSTPETSDDTQLSAAIHRLDPSRFPATIAVADSMPVPLEDEFAFGLDLILNGLAQVRDSDRS